MYSLRVHYRQKTSADLFDTQTATPNYKVTFFDVARSFTVHQVFVTRYFHTSRSTGRSIDLDCDTNKSFKAVVCDINQFLNQQLLCWVRAGASGTEHVSYDILLETS